MSTTQQDLLSATDQEILESLQPSVDELTIAGRRRLLTYLARSVWSTQQSDLPIVDDHGEIFAYLHSAGRPILDLRSMFTKEELASIERNVTDPKNLFSWQEVLAQLEAEDNDIRPEQTGRSAVDLAPSLISRP